MSTPPKDLFKRYTTPPTPLHAAVQGRAREAGWIPPWEHEEQQKEQQSQNTEAGKKSGLVRGERAEVRRLIIQLAYLRLDPKYKHQPYSTNSIDALHREYLSVVGKGGDAPWPHIAPTDKEIDLFISLMAQAELLEERADIYRSFEDRSLGAPPPPRTTKEEFDLHTSLVISMMEWSETDRKALEKVSRDTLRQGLKQLGVKSRRRTRRSG